MEAWLVVLGLLNLALFASALVLVLPKGSLTGFMKDPIGRLRSFALPLLLVVGVVALHLVEVHVLDPYLSATLAQDYTQGVVTLEGSTVLWVSQHAVPALAFVLAVIYIGIYPFILWFTPLLFLLSDQRQAMQTFAVGLLLVYLIALPFYLFLPVTNVHTFNGVPSALEAAIPTVDTFFYATTTVNNCFPSLHVAVALFTALTVWTTDNRRFKVVTAVVAGAVVVSVIYLAIHWIVDVVGGILVATAVFYLVNRRRPVLEPESHESVRRD